MRPEMVFVYPHYRDYQFTGFGEHYGAACIRAFLARTRTPSEAYVSADDRPLRDHARAIHARGAHTVGFTIFDTNYHVCRLLARELKRLEPETCIVGGGPSATFSYDTILEDPECPFDVLIRGYGEHAVEALLAHPGDYATMPSAAFREGQRIVATPQPATSRALDELPSPYLAGILAPELVFRIGTCTSRGCVFHCSYCNFAAMSGFAIRYHSVERVLEEIRFVIAETRQRRKSEKLMMTFLDDHFTLNSPRVIAICEAIVGEGLNAELQFNCDTRGDALDRPLLELLRRAGCYSMNFGLESASPRVLATIHKVRRHGDPAGDCTAERRYLDTIVANVAAAESVGIKTCVSIILGLPSETADEGRATLAFVDGLANHSYAHNYLQVYRGTEAFETAASYRIGVRPSMTRLPYITEPAYDVLALPVLDDKITVNLSVRKNEQLNDHLRLTTGSHPPASGSRTLVSLNAAAAEVDDAMLDGLSRHLTPAARLYVHGWTDAQLASLYERLAARETPTVAFYAGVADGALEAVSLVDRGERTVLSRAFTTWVERLPFAAHAVFLQDYTARNGRESITVFDIASRRDVQALEAVCERGQETGVLALPHNLAFYKCGLCDACRWGHARCREPQQGGVHRVSIDAARRVRLCPDGPVVGSLDEESPMWEARMTAALDEAERRRGCRTCPVADRCSHCIAPRALDDQEYCAFRRQHPIVGDFVALYELKSRLAGGYADFFKKDAPDRQIYLRPRRTGRSVAYRTPDPPLAAPQEPVPSTVTRARLRETSRLCLIRGVGHVIDLRKEEVVQLSPALTEMWEAMERHRPAGEIVSFFCSRYGLPAAEVVQNMTRALAIFQEEGLIV